MYFGNPYVIDLPSAAGSITIYQPSFNDIIQMGQTKFFASIDCLAANTTAYRLPLWEMGLDWNEFKDYHLFLMLYKNVDPDVSKLIFHDFDISTFEIFEKKKDGENEDIILYNEELEIEINEDVYHHLSQFLRKIFSISADEKITSDPIMKEWFITKDKRQREIDKEKKGKGKEVKTSILSLISTCVNHPGFKYNIQQLRDITMFQFYDAVRRLQIYENSTAVLKGMYSGFVDSKKISADSYNFMR